jgi:hypothetical protein
MVDGGGGVGSVVVNVVDDVVGVDASLSNCGFVQLTCYVGIIINIVSVSLLP